jgi:hypothetical protein
LRSRWGIDRDDLPAQTAAVGRDLKVTDLRGIVLQAIDLAAKVKVTVRSVHQQKNNSRSPGMA